MACMRAARISRTGSASCLQMHLSPPTKACMSWLPARQASLQTSWRMATGCTCLVRAGCPSQVRYTVASLSCHDWSCASFSPERDNQELN